MNSTCVLTTTLLLRLASLLVLGFSKYFLIQYTVNGWLTGCMCLYVGYVCVCTNCWTQSSRLLAPFAFMFMLYLNLNVFVYNLQEVLLAGINFMQYWLEEVLGVLNVTETNISFVPSPSWPGIYGLATATSQSRSNVIMRAVPKTSKQSFFMFLQFFLS